MHIVTPIQRGAAPTRPGAGRQDGNVLAALSGPRSLPTLPKDAGPPQSTTLTKLVLLHRCQQTTQPKRWCEPRCGPVSAAKGLSFPSSGRTRPKAASPGCRQSQTLPSASAAAVFALRPWQTAGSALFSTRRFSRKPGTSLATPAAAGTMRRSRTSLHQPTTLGPSSLERTSRRNSSPKRWPSRRRSTQGRTATPLLTPISSPISCQTLPRKGPKNGPTGVRPASPGLLDHFFRSPSSMPPHRTDVLLALLSAPPHVSGG